MLAQPDRIAQAEARLLLSDLNAELAALLVSQASAFHRCLACRIEAYAVKRDPRGAGWCPRTYDQQHMWDVYPEPDQIDLEDED